MVMKGAKTCKVDPRRLSYNPLGGHLYIPVLAHMTNGFQSSLMSICVDTGAFLSSRRPQ
jgi:hypothetical protein